MEAIVLLLALAAPGVQYGYQPRPDGSMEYIIQIEPELLDQLKAGQQITSEIPPEVEGVKRFVIRVGNGPPPRIVPPTATTVRMPPRTLPEATGSSPIQLAATDRYSAPVPDANGGLPEGVKPSPVGAPANSSSPSLGSPSSSVPDLHGGLPEGVKPLGAPAAAETPRSRFTPSASSSPAIAPTPLELTPSSPVRDRNAPTPATTSSSDPRFALPPTSPTTLGPTSPSSGYTTSSSSPPGYGTSPSAPTYGAPTYSPPASAPAYGTPAYGTPPTTTYNPPSYSPPAAYTPPASTPPTYGALPPASPVATSNSDLRNVPSRRNDRFDDRDRDDRSSSSRYSSRDDDRDYDRRDSYDRDRDRRDSYARRDDLDRDRVYSPSQQVLKVPESSLAVTQPAATPAVTPAPVMPATNLAAQPQTPVERPWMAFTVVGILLMLSLGVNFYLGWMVWEARMRWPDMANESNRRLRRTNAAA